MQLAEDAPAAAAESAQEAGAAVQEAAGRALLGQVGTKLVSLNRC